MKSKKISRREFVKATALASGAVVLAACTPNDTIQTTAEDLTEKEPLNNIKTTGETMKILIIYDTVYGNTEKIAEAIQQAVSKEHEAKLIKAKDATSQDVENIDLLIVGSPTHGGWYIESIKNFFNQIPDNGLKMNAAAFDTSSDKEGQKAFVKAIIGFFGYASPRIAKTLAKKGAKVIGSETFLVLDTEGPLKEGEIERAKKWGNDVIKMAMET
jgi:flavodoxin